MGVTRATSLQSSPTLTTMLKCPPKPYSECTQLLCGLTQPPAQGRGPGMKPSGGTRAVGVDKHPNHATLPQPLFSARKRVGVASQVGCHGHQFISSVTRVYGRKGSNTSFTSNPRPSSAPNTNPTDLPVCPLLGGWGLVGDSFLAPHSVGAGLGPFHAGTYF